MKIKKMLVMAAILLGLNNVAFAGTFSDIAPNHWIYQKVEDMKNRGIISGFEDGTFRPQNPVTREQFASILEKTLGLSGTTSTNIKFEDVNNNRWSKKSINAVAKYLTGYSVDGKYYFRPTEYAVREDMAVAVVKARGLEDETPNYKVLNKFSDKELISDGLRKYVAIAVENGIMSGNTNGTFNPLGSLTRAEVVALMYNVSDKVALDDIIKNQKYEVDVWGSNAKIYGNGMYESGEKVTVTVIPNEGYRYLRIQKAFDITAINVQKKSDRVILTFKMPNRDAEINVKMEEIEEEEYEVDVWGSNAKITGNGVYEPGEEVTITVTPNKGYKYLRIQSTTIPIRKIDVDKRSDKTILTFEMPDEDVEINVTMEKAEEKYEVEVWGAHSTIYGNGTYTPGEQVTVIVIPDEGYKYLRIQKAFDVTALKVLNLGDRIMITFRMPSRDADIDLKIVEK